LFRSEQAQAQDNSQNREEERRVAYYQLVAQALLKLDDWFELEDYPVLSQMPAVVAYARSHSYDILPHGQALSQLLRRAVEEVSSQCATSPGRTMQRAAVYLRSRYLEKQTVKTIAQQLGISTDQLGRTVGVLSIPLVAKQFYRLARGQYQKGECDENTSDE